MSRSISEAVALFRSHLQQRRFDGTTLRILESILVARDVESLLVSRAALRGLLLSEASSVMGGASGMTVEKKLRIVQFFVGAFALIGDGESCLALKYEALILRESNCVKVQGLEVSYDEWLTFAKDSLDNGFYPIAIQGNKIEHREDDDPRRDRNHLRPDRGHDSTANMSDTSPGPQKVVQEILPPQSPTIQTQTAKYLKSKGRQEGQVSSSLSDPKVDIASSTFRCGINKRNLQMLQRSRGLQ
ncbi:protein DOUBLE-STRAND BREAK FORMATION-like isoform X2 [Zingiber officinale]|uniref:protein DOUBLE-STRAND BREAK FORMATION-like isoform X2 n=1 Tax=Zingiber officinale TaxID=94328 RepID=UPI001C4D4B9F|nr:protein DOUBLE-STRAND BREAK FORMATION-like isoform X2 [Zingiber officinale]